MEGEEPEDGETNGEGKVDFRSCVKTKVGVGILY